MFQEPDSTLLLASGMGRHWPDGRGIFCNNNNNLFVWLNEEDHLRIVSMQGDRSKCTEQGKQIKEVAWGRACCWGAAVCAAAAGKRRRERHERRWPGSLKAGPDAPGVRALHPRVRRSAEGLEGEGLRLHAQSAACREQLRDSRTARLRGPDGLLRVL